MASAVRPDLVSSLAFLIVRAIAAPCYRPKTANISVYGKYTEKSGKDKDG